MASDASPEMKETIQLLKQLGISTETMGLLNETSGYSQKETQLVEDARAGKDLGCISGTTQNCIAPTPEKTLGAKTIDFVNEATLKQVWAAAGLKNDVLTGEEITANDKQMAILTLISGGLVKFSSVGMELTEAGVKSLVREVGEQNAQTIQKSIRYNNPEIYRKFLAEQSGIPKYINLSEPKGV